MLRNIPAIYDDSDDNDGDADDSYVYLNDYVDDDAKLNAQFDTIDAKLTLYENLMNEVLHALSQHETSMEDTT